MQMKLVILTIFLTLFACTPEKSKGGSTLDEIKEQLEHKEVPDTSGTDSGKEDQPVTEDAIPAEVLASAEVTDLMVEKAAAYRKASVAKGKRNGVYVYSGATFDSYITKPEKLAARIYMLGFKDVYLSPGSSRISNASSGLRSFIASCSRLGIEVHAVGLSSLQNLVNDKNTTSEVNSIINYNNKVEYGQKFAGISADLEPHTCHDSNVPSGLGLVWDSSTNYGIGKDNDQLLHLTLDRLATAGTALHNAGLKLSEAIFYNYQINYDLGQLEYGSSSQFLRSCDFLIVMAYRRDKESIWSKSEPAIKAAGKANSVSVCIKTRINADSGTTIQDLGWNNLLSVVRYVNEKGSSYPAYRGLDMFTFDGIETMWEWTNDKN